MYVGWEAPERITRPAPIVLVHGGGGQGTDWLGTPDGRPGWAGQLVREGYLVYTVDRPGHGRSPHHPAVLGEMGSPFSYQALRELFAPGREGHTQWPGDGGLDDPLFDQVAAPTGPMLADLGAGQALDADRLTKLLESAGPAIVVTHSAGAPGGWLAADARPELIRALVAIEPMGPPFLADPHGGPVLPWGLTAAPMTYQPAVADPAELAGGRFELPRLSGIPIAVLTAEASAFAEFGPQVVEFLRAAGCDATEVRLAEHGVRGNGHGLMFERNNMATLRVVLDWLTSVGVSGSGDAGSGQTA
ncbi:MAG: alpha/beta fold hydrolase [Pseudonocardiaceae bacterium]|nr:alpha/beta fold hydrolase [Pseudonocardiaceae bacterium]